MENTPLTKLDLRTPLFYAKTDVFPEKTLEKDEFLLCYTLNPAQSNTIEPDRGQFLGTVEFVGRKTAGSDVPMGETVSLPAGNYLFTQSRNALNSEEWLDMAIEQQKDGLWERHKPESMLFVRFLYEDGEFVTQIFRPLKS